MSSRLSVRKKAKNTQERGYQRKRYKPKRTKRKQRKSHGGSKKRKSRRVSKRVSRGGMMQQKLQEPYGPPPSLEFEKMEEMMAREDALEAGSEPGLSRFERAKAAAVAAKARAASSLRRTPCNGRAYGCSHRSHRSQRGESARRGQGRGWHQHGDGGRVEGAF